MKFDAEICEGVSCPECPFNKGEDGCLLAERLDEIEIILEPCEDAVPSAQPEQKRGKWIPVTNGRGGHECSLCHSYALSFQTGDEWLTDYCPTCGADMMGRT